MKSTILFKSDARVGPAKYTKRPRSAVNDNFRSLEFEITQQERDWRLLCLVATVICGMASLTFLPMW